MYINDLKSDKIFWNKIVISIMNILKKLTRNFLLLQKLAKFGNFNQDIGLFQPRKVHV
jgi:hypothetical protein